MAKVPLPQQRRGQVLLQRRAGMALAVAATVQAVAGQVKADLRLVLVQMNVQPQIGLLFFHRWPAAADFAHAIDDRILGLESDELRVVQLRARHRRRHGNAVARQQVPLPLDPVNRLVERVFAVDRSLPELAKDPVGEPRKQAYPVRVGDGRRDFHAAVSLVQSGPRGLEDNAQLVQQGRFEAFVAGDKEFKILHEPKQRRGDQMPMVCLLSENC